MRRLCQLCFLVLSVSSVLQEKTTITPYAGPQDDKLQESKQQQNLTSQAVDEDDHKGLNVSTTLGLNDTKEGTANTSVSTTSAPVTTSPISQPSQDSPLTTTEGKQEPSEVPTTDSGPASTTAATSKPGSSSWGYVILVVILILIFALCFILFMLRRASRTYSFDLQRPVISSNTYEPTGTFGQVYLDDLDRPANKDMTSEDLSTTPVPNGTSPQLGDKPPDGDSAAAEEQPKANDLQSSSSSSSPSSSGSLSGDDQVETKSAQISSNIVFFDTTEEQQQQQQEREQNENNNNLSVYPNHPFVEINLDEPASSNQPLTSLQQTTSVLPFFSFSSSSDSS